MEQRGWSSGKRGRTAANLWVFFLYLGKKQTNSIFPVLEFVRLFVVVQNLLFSFFYLFSINSPFSFVPFFLRPPSLSRLQPNSLCCKKEKEIKNT